jgi:hypothetical protein
MLLIIYRLNFARAIRTICAVTAIVSILVPQSRANILNGRIKVIPSRAIAVPNKIVGNNSVIVGISIHGFDLKNIYPYFSINIDNAHNPSFHPMENHHIYSGLLLLGIGDLTHKQYLRTIGKILIIDDLVEHCFNVKSGLNFAFSKINPRIYSKITGSADKLFK